MFVWACLCSVKSTAVDEMYHINYKIKKEQESTRGEKNKKNGFVVVGKGPSLVHLHPQFVSFDSAFKGKAISQSQGGKTPSE